MLALTQNSVEGLGSRSPGLLLSGTVLPAEKARRATEKREDTVARPRWQQGWLFQRGKRTKKWIGRYREDVIGEDGQRCRRSRSVVLGPVREVSKRQAQRKLSEYLAAINQGTHKPEVMITFERFVLERFEPNILRTIHYSTQRLYRSLSRNPTGESLKALQTQMGHTDSRLTLGVYTQPMPEAQRQLAAKVERVLLPVAPKLSTPGNSSEGVIQ
jgi:hypothetical protein